MSRYLCMNCWRVSEQNDLWMKCPACSEPDPAEPSEDWLLDPNEAAVEAVQAMRRVGEGGRSWLRVLLGDSGEAVGARCESHPQATVKLHCFCGMPVQPRAYLRQGKPLVLGFAGPRSAGKTMLILAMIHELRRGLVAGRRLGLSGIGDTEHKFGTLMTAFLSQGKKPEATAQEIPDEMTEHDTYSQVTGVTTNSFCWELVADGAGGRKPSMLLGIYDLAGETWGQGLEDRLERFDRYLGLLASLVFVVDGAALASDLGLPATDAWDAAPRRVGDMGSADHQWLARLVDRLGDHAKKVHLALVISKADLIWNHPRWESLKPAADGSGLEEASLAPTSLDEVLGEGYRRDLLLVARQKFKSVRGFAVSSLGFRPQEADVSGDRLVRAIEPTGVIEPLSWLLAESWPALRN